MTRKTKALHPNPKVMGEIFSKDELYRGYVDGLMLIHDKVAPLSSVHGPARFNEKDQKHLWKKTLEDVHNLSHAVERNLIDNKQIADRLYTSYKHDPMKYHEEPRNVENVDSFLDDLIKIYTEVTHIKHGLPTK